MARKIAVPAEQLQRLKELYNQERQALVAFAAAQEVDRRAEQDLSAAQHALEDAHSGVDAAYQALVQLVGTGVAAELTGRSRGGSHRARAKHRDEGGGVRTGGSDAGHDDEASPGLVGGVVG